MDACLCGSSMMNISEAIAQESEDDLLDMAFYRLIYAYELSKEARQQFLEYIVNHKKRLSELIIRKRDSGLLQSFWSLKMVRRIYRRCPGCY